MSNIVNTYNARYLEPKQVADKFIYSESFQILLNNTNTIILGARGCGKTTLMKMLTVPALHSWNHEKAEKIKKEIPFYAVYVSTDIYWDAKNKIKENQLNNFENFANKISKFSVNHNVFYALCVTFQSILDYENLCNPSEKEKKEIELCQYLIDNWRLERTIPLIQYVKEAIRKRISEVNIQIQKIIFNYSDFDSALEEEYFNFDFDSSISYLVEIFGRIFNLPPEKKWALCFDELEFAPKWLQEQLYTSLRSRNDQKMLYKVSSSPILPKELEGIFISDYSPTEGNDLDLIKMWNLNDSEQFSTEIIKSLLSQHSITKSPTDFFGTNIIYNKKVKGIYKEGEDFNNEIVELIEKDELFSEYLKQKNIDILSPIPKSNSEKDTLYRKIKQVVYFRNSFIESNKFREEKTLYRSRSKTPKLYYGIEVLTKICDGNPRWLIGLLNEILLNSNKDKANENIQFDKILSTANRFRNSIKNIPIQLNDPSQSIDSIIERIGNNFREQLLGKKIIVEPKFLFEFNISDNNDLKTIIEKGLFQGAFILVDKTGDQKLDFDFFGKEMKLSYLFHIQFDIPIRKSSDSIQLSGLSSNLLQTNLFEQNANN